MAQQWNVHVILCGRRISDQEQQATKTEVKQNKMLHSKRREYTANNQDVTYTELKTCKSPWKHRIPTVKQSPEVLCEEQLKYGELTFHRTPQPQPRKQAMGRKRQGTVLCPFCNWSILTRGLRLWLSIPVTTILVVTMTQHRILWEDSC